MTVAESSTSQTQTQTLNNYQPPPIALTAPLLLDWTELVELIALFSALFCFCNILHFLHLDAFFCNPHNNVYMICPERTDSRPL